MASTKKNRNVVSNLAIYQISSRFPNLGIAISARFRGKGPSELRSFLVAREKEILNLPSLGFDQFPDGTANRLHQYNIFDFVDKEILELKDAVRTILCSYEPSLGEGAWITGWINILYRGQKLGWHSHEEDEHSKYSGVLFLETGQATLNFQVAPGGKVVKIKDRPGRLVIFNSATRHETDECAATRVSLAFDVRTGPRRSPLWVQL